MIERRFTSPTSEIEPIERIKLLDREAKLLLQLLEGNKSEDEIEALRGTITRLCLSKDRNSINQLASIVSGLYTEALRTLPGETLERLSKSVESTETPIRISALEALIAERTKGPPIPEAK